MNDTKRSVTLGVSLAGLGLLAFVTMGVDTRQATPPRVTREGGGDLCHR